MDGDQDLIEDHDEGNRNRPAFAVHRGVRVLGAQLHLVPRGAGQAEHPFPGVPRGADPEGLEQPLVRGHDHAVLDYRIAGEVNDKPVHDGPQGKGLAGGGAGGSKRQPERQGEDEDKDQGAAGRRSLHDTYHLEQRRFAATISATAGPAGGARGHPVPLLSTRGAGKFLPAMDGAVKPAARTS